MAATGTAWGWGDSPGYWWPSSLQVSVTAFSVSLITFSFSFLHVALWLSCWGLHTSLYLLTLCRKCMLIWKGICWGGVQILIFFFWNLTLTVFFFVFTWGVYISIETAKQKMEKDILHQKADLKILRKRKKITELQKEFKQLLNLNQSLPKHLRLTHEVHMCCHKSNTLESIIWKALQFMSSGLNTFEKLFKQFDTGRHTSSRLKQSATNQRWVVFSQRGEDTSCTKTELDL